MDTVVVARVWNEAEMKLSDVLDESYEKMKIIKYSLKI